MIDMKNITLLTILATTLIFGLKIQHHNLLHAKIRSLIPNHKTSYLLTHFQQSADPFRAADKDNNGQVTSEQLLACLQAQGQQATLQDVQNMVMLLDDDQNGSIQRIEFDSWIKRASTANNIEDFQLKQTFRQFDSNGDGKITKEQMKSLSSKIGVDVTSDEADSTFNQFDQNKDQSIDISEFSQILKLVSASH